MVSPKRFDFPISKKGIVTKAGTHRAVVYVPSTTAQDKPISKRELKRRVSLVSKEVSSIFGGDTVQRGAFGNWLDEKGRLVREKIVRIEFFTTPKSYKRNDAKIGRLIHQLARKWGQWGISFEYQSPRRSRALYFIHPVEKKRLERMV